MSFGEALSRAWNGATDAAREAASALGSGARWVGRKSAEIAQAAVDATVEAARAVEAMLEDLGRAAKSAGRDGMRGAGDTAFDALGSGAETLGDIKKGMDGIADRAAAAFRRAREFFTGDAPEPVKPCPKSTADKNSPSSDKGADGWIMVPKGPGRPCELVPPGNADAARAAATLSTEGRCAAERASGAKPRDIVYVNGINTTRATHCATLNAIAAQTCGRVIGVYNATEGFARDAAQTAQDRRLIKLASEGKSVGDKQGRNPAVDTLADLIVEDSFAGDPPEIWAHSQGGAVTSLALFEARGSLGVVTGDADPLAGVKVKSFGSAAPKWPDGPEYEHYVHVNDATPSLFGLGHAERESQPEAGRGAKIIRFSGNPDGDAPFSATPTLDVVPKSTSNHDVVDTYLRMERQAHGDGVQ